MGLINLLLNLVLALGILLFAACLFVAYRWLAPRRTPGIRGEHAITELLSIPVNGIRQWLLIRGVDRRKPILLFLHGGPGTAQIAVMRNYQKELEKHFVVVQWDQRGAGLTALDPAPDDSYTKEQFIADGLEVTRYLLQRFKQEKIFLVGHSWGSGLGYMMAHRKPEYYRAFAGIGQMSRNGEALAYAETLRIAREVKNQRAIEELEELGAPPYQRVPQVKGVLHTAEAGHESFAGMQVRFKWSAILGGDAKYINITAVFIRNLLLSSEYTWKDAFDWLKHKAHSINLMYESCNQNIDLYQEGTEFTIPLFFLLGKWDLLTVPAGAVALFEAIQAPQKQVFWFDAGHEIMWERPGEYQQALIECFSNE